MRDYDNLPQMPWQDDDDTLPVRIRNQVMHQEPVILAMPAGFDFGLDTDGLSCRRDEATGILLDCAGGPALERLAERNGMTGLRQVATAAAESSSRVDIDAAGGRLVIHD